MIESCEITSASIDGIGIFVVGRKSFVEVKNTTFHCCGLCGVYCGFEAECVVSLSVLCDNDNCGVMVDQKNKSCRLDRCIISNNFRSGVDVRNHGKATLNGCTLLDNKLVGVLASEKSLVTLIECCGLNQPNFTKAEFSSQFILQNCFF